MRTHHLIRRASSANDLLLQPGATLFEPIQPVQDLSAILVGEVFTDGAGEVVDSLNDEGDIVHEFFE